ncbi:hypothetical protein Tco_1244350 [Tanacetum coccineum]
MEILSLIIKRWARLSDTFRYHHHCKELRIINVCFADDRFIFVRGEVESAKVIMDSLEEFKQISGLVSSLLKSTTYFYNVRNHVKHGILNIMPVSEGKLPVKYLGVPIISSRLLNKDCKILIGKGLNLSVWYDCWCDQCPLIRFLTPRDITLEGFNLQNKVVDFVSNGVWSWPQSWLLKAPNLEQIMFPTLDTSRPDLPQWHDLNGKMSNFVISCAWEALRPRRVKVWNLVRPLAGIDLVQPRIHDIRMYL